MRRRDQSAFQCKCLARCHPDKGSSTILKCSLSIRQIISLPTRWASDCKNYQCHTVDCCVTLARPCGGLRASTDPLLRKELSLFFRVFPPSLHYRRTCACATIELAAHRILIELGS